MRAFASHPIDFGASFKDNHVDGVRNCNALTETERNKGEITKQKRAQKDQVKARTYMFTPMLLPENHGMTRKKLIPTRPKDRAQSRRAIEDYVLQPRPYSSTKWCKEYIYREFRQENRSALHDTFPAFGNIWSYKLALDPSSKSKGYGFVQFDNEESAQKAIEQLNGMLLNQKETLLVARQILTIVFVKNFSESTTKEDLNKIFDGFGPITSVVVIRDADGKAKELQIYQKHMTPLQLLCCQVEEI
ncbi:hypothetical protein GQ457_17G004190 [Hibiscus cannabinus]